MDGRQRHVGVGGGVAQSITSRSVTARSATARTTTARTATEPTASAAPSERSPQPSGEPVPPGSHGWSRARRFTGARPTPTPITPPRHPTPAHPHGPLPAPEPRIITRRY